MAYQMKDSAKAQRMNIAVNIWTARIIPIILAGIVGYATYVLVVVLCVDYLLVKHGSKSAAVPILVIYFLLFLLMAVSFFRLIYITTFDPPVVPLGPSAIRNIQKSRNRGEKSRVSGNGIGGGEYDSRGSSGDTSRNTTRPQEDPDSPGLELFYTKDIFMCELDGKPKWCSHCANWKPDRAHHCSTNGRCILRMDHFCPWVGGPIGENNMKFFIQFTSYTALYCLNLLVVMGIYVARQRSSKDENVNAELAVILGLAGFFFLFTAGMAGSSIGDAMWNLTQVERLGAQTRIHTMAVIKPSQDKLFQINPDLASQPPYAEITYPLGAGIPTLGRSQEPGVPSIKTNSHAGQWRPSSVTPRLELKSESPSDSSSKNLPTATEPSNATSTFPIVPSVQQSPGSNSNAASEDSTATTLGGREHFSERDLRATRTFAILSMADVNQNPWDLGSALLNVKSLMGTNIIDWFLPLQRSPCCNHESTESHYAVGPYVENARRIAGFVEGNAVSVRERKRRKHRSHKSHSDRAQTSSHNANLEMDRFKNSRSRGSTEGNVSAANGEGLP